MVYPPVDQTGKPSSNYGVLELQNYDILAVTRHIGETIKMVEDVLGWI